MEINMIEMVEYDDHFVPKLLCTMTNPLTSSGKSFADDCFGCEEYCQNNCSECIIQKIFDEYAKLTNQIKEM